MTDASRMVRLDDPEVVVEQYRDPVRLSTRQGIWAFRRPPIDFVSWALGHVELDGDKTVLDVGCGNGQYLRVLVQRGHRGPLVGVDISIGMLSAVTPVVSRAAGDAQALPIADSAADLTLAMHMLYHVADKQLAAGELRRVTKRQGCLVVALPARHSLIELHQLIGDCASRVGLSISPHHPGLALEEAAILFEGLFETVRRLDVPGELHVTDPRPVLDYVASLSRVARSSPVPEQRELLLGCIDDRVTTRIALEGSFTLTATGGCLICQ